MQLLCVLVFSLHVSVAHAVDCYANPGQPLASCDRWIACAASNGTQCDNGSGALGTQLYAKSREHVCLHRLNHSNMRTTQPPLHSPAHRLHHSIRSMRMTQSSR